MTPLEIQILIHYHYSPEDYHNLTSLSQVDAIDGFVKDGFLLVDHHGSQAYKPTQKLHDFINSLCKIAEEFRFLEKGRADRLMEINRIMNMK